MSANSNNPSRRAFIATAACAALPVFGAGPAAAAALAPEFVGIDSWLNSGPLSMRALRGRPALVTFWTYGCINCIHAMPAIKGWYARYRDRGFEVIGVHTPEFQIEHSRENLQQAIGRFGIQYPVAQDNESATWNAWGNRYWPAEYLVDANGRIVHSHFGEGGYAETESVIQRLLAGA
jgi:thiol-disulfide isomerase/thioredoxin